MKRFAKAGAMLSVALVCGFTSDTRFGVRIDDPYRWLENKSSPDVETWLNAQERSASAYLNTPLRQKFIKKFKKLYYVDTVSAPEREGGRLFYQRQRADHDKPLYYVRDRQGERLLLDAETLRGSVGEWKPAPDGRAVAYTLHPKNSDAAVIHVFAVESGKEDARDTLPGADYAAISWSADSAGFFYFRLQQDSSLPAAERVAKADIRYHRLHRAGSEDELVFPPTGDASTYLTPAADREGRYLLVSADHGWSNNALYARDLKSPATGFFTLFTSTCATASAIAWKGSFYLLTNEAAPQEKILEAPAGPKPVWKTLVAERPDVVLRSMQVIGGRLVLVTLHNAESAVELRPLSGEAPRTLALPSGSIDEVHGHEEDPEMFVSFESFFIPPRVYQTNSAIQTLRTWGQSDVPSDPSRFELSHVSYPSKDGTQIPLWLIRPKKSKGPIPFLIHGYGGFDTPMVPRFNEMQLAWLEEGGGIAVPELRGGGEFGEAWHRAGMLEQKQHTFDDFIGAAEFLVQKGYTQKQKLAIQGASNGGLSVAAFLTQRPELVQAAICKNPVTDMIRYPLFGEGKAWVPEYGDPTKEKDFRFLYAYSPYHHARAGAAYPATLFLSAAEDDRVDPLHARKMAAALQKAGAGGSPILFRSVENAGHEGAGRRDALVAEAADRLTFLVQALGMAP
jgi:prolyl oligopeptidase